MKADGWCLVRAVAKGMSDEDLKDLIDKVIIKANDEKFQDLLGTVGLKKLEDYRDRKVWDSDVLDIVPYILSEVMDQSIIICVIANDNLHNVLVINEMKG